jgi:exodeoxyribonuclease VII large subunit
MELYDGATQPIFFGDRRVWSVTGFLMGVRKRVLELPSMWVTGEISDFKHQHHLSMVYFTLKDPENGFRLGCTIPRTRFEQLGIELSDGDRVQIFGRAELYAPQGAFQLKAQSIEHVGRGQLMQQLEALKQRLAAEGLFDDDRKKPIPHMPRRVGVITGADAAAQGDFLRNVFERFPPAKLVMVETLVQGERAAPMLVAALRKLERVEDVDVIVITRGGGAFEHFLPFCDERLCRAIAACPKPVISAIGHEKDNPLSDYVADLRVSTPTAAARTVVPDHGALVTGLARQLRAVRGRMGDRCASRSAGLASLRVRLTNRSPMHIVNDRRSALLQLRGRGRACTSATIDRRREALLRTRPRLGSFATRVTGCRATLLKDCRALERAIVGRVGRASSRHRQSFAALRALSPAATLDRGYSIVRREADGTLVRDAASVAAGEQVTITVSRGRIGATVDTAEEGTPHGR